VPDLARQEVQRDDAGLGHQVMADRRAFVVGGPEVPLARVDLGRDAGLGPPRV
jgi:hypothetical protein